MTGQTSAAAVGQAPPTATNELGDDRATVDGRALDSVDAQIAKGVRKVEVSDYCLLNEKLYFAPSNETKMICLRKNKTRI